MRWSVQLLIDLGWFYWIEHAPHMFDFNYLKFSNPYTSACDPGCSQWGLRHRRSAMLSRGCLNPNVSCTDSSVRLSEILFLCVFFPLCQDDQVQYRIMFACLSELSRQAIWYLEFMNEAPLFSAVHSSSPCLRLSGRTFCALSCYFDCDTVVFLPDC